MTEQEPCVAHVVVQENSRLEQLMAQWPASKARADAANAELDALKAAIKSEMAASAPGASNVSAASTYGSFSLVWRTPWKFDVKRLKVEDPHTYVRYASKAKGHWELREGA